MKFYVVYKQTGVQAKEADSIEKVEYTGEPFMIVAAEPVKAGKIYQAIQINENKVQLNYKPTAEQAGHEFIEAATIAEALGGEPKQEEPANTDPTPDPVTPFESVTYTFESYNADGSVHYATGTAKTEESDVTGKTKIKVVTNEPEMEGVDFSRFVGATFYVDSTVVVGDGELHTLYDENNEAVSGLKVKIIA